jgi:hypothetical protein
MGARGAAWDIAARRIKRWCALHFDRDGEEGWIVTDLLCMTYEGFVTGLKMQRADGD